MQPGSHCAQSSFNDAPAAAPLAATAPADAGSGYTSRASRLVTLLDSISQARTDTQSGSK